MAEMTKEHGHKVGFYSTLPHHLRNNFVNEVTKFRDNQKLFLYRKSDKYCNI